jgi:aspartyl protease family protein
MHLKLSWVHFMAYATLLGSASAAATSVAVVGLFKDKAIVRIDGDAPRVIAVGARVAGVKLIAASSEGATVETDGQRRVLGMGQSFAGGVVDDTRRRVSLTADARGHFSAAGSINGFPLTFLVDTGATAISINAADASRIGVDYKAGQASMVNTAAGVVPAWRVSFNNVKLGGITLNQVEGLVVETGLNIPLLGMSFLNRTDMSREGQTMTLIQRY